VETDAAGGLSPIKALAAILNGVLLIGSFFFGTGVPKVRAVDVAAGLEGSVSILSNMTFFCRLACGSSAGTID